MRILNKSKTSAGLDVGVGRVVGIYRGALSPVPGGAQRRVISVFRPARFTTLTRPHRGHGRGSLPQHQTSMPE